jgi:hypothetical protein
MEPATIDFREMLIIISASFTGEIPIILKIPKIPISPPPPKKIFYLYFTNSEILVK